MSASEMPPFRRTVCACRECVKCCHRQPGPLAPGDIDQIAQHLGKTIDDVKPMFWASPGALVGMRATGAIHRIGTITPRMEGQRCVFLTAEDRCSIHAVAPFGCAFFDQHSVWQERAVWLYRHIDNSQTYRQIRSTLVRATSWLGMSVDASSSE